LFHAFFCDRVPQGAALHVNLIDANVLFQLLSPCGGGYTPICSADQRVSYPQVPPQSPLPLKIKRR
jgi:hypothetical protein